MPKSGDQGDLMTRHWACLDRCDSANQKLANLRRFFGIGWDGYVVNHGCALTTGDLRATLWITLPGLPLSFWEILGCIFQTRTYGGLRAIWRTIVTGIKVQKVEDSYLKAGQCCHISNICARPGQSGAIRDLFRPFLAFCDQMGWSVLLEEVHDPTDPECVRVFEIYRNLGFTVKGYHKLGQGLPDDAYCYMVRRPQPQT